MSVDRLLANKNSNGYDCETSKVSAKEPSDSLVGDEGLAEVRTTSVHASPRIGEESKVNNSLEVFNRSSNLAIGKLCGVKSKGKYKYAITPQEKAELVSFFYESKSIIKAQRKFQTKYGRKAPERKSIRRWVKSFEETGSFLKKKSPGRPNKSLERSQAVLEAFREDPKTSIRKASFKLKIPQTSIHRILHKDLKLRCYKT